MKKKTQSKPKKITLEQSVEAAMKVTYSMEPRQDMPLRFKDDPEAVKLLVEESERVNALGNAWQGSKTPNPLAAEMCWRMGWAYSLAAAWLRARLKGEVGPAAALKDKLPPTLRSIADKMLKRPSNIPPIAVDMYSLKVRERLETLQANSPGFDPTPLSEFAAGYAAALENVRRYGLERTAANAQSGTPK